MSCNPEKPLLRFKMIYQKLVFGCEIFSSAQIGNFQSVVEGGETIGSRSHQSLFSVGSLFSAEYWLEYDSQRNQCHD